MWNLLLSFSLPKIYLVFFHRLVKQLHAMMDVCLCDYEWYLLSVEAIRKQHLIFLNFIALPLPCFKGLNLLPKRDHELQVCIPYTPFFTLNEQNHQYSGYEIINSKSNTPCLKQNRAQLKPWSKDEPNLKMKTNQKPNTSNTIHQWPIYIFLSTHILFSPLLRCSRTLTSFDFWILSITS